MVTETAEVLITLFYILFTVCVVYPPTEFVSAGFTIAQLFDSYLGSENNDFVMYHMKRVTVTQIVHSLLLSGYIFCLWCGGVNEWWLSPAAILTAIYSVLNGFMVASWWTNMKRSHPIVKPLLPYETEGIDWRVVAGNLNGEFKSIDKVSIQLTATSKFIATHTWLIKLTQCELFVVKQSDCALVATSTDSHNLSASGEDEVQYVNIEAIPSRSDVRPFTIRVSALALRDLQPRLLHPVRVPDHLHLLPTLVERFVGVFKVHVDENPLYYSDQELEQCIGCMQAPANVKLNRRCPPAPPDPVMPVVRGPYPAPVWCQTCNCRPLWCVSCMGRWWAARATGPPAGWLAGRCTCPVCRAVFCVRDVCPAVHVPHQVTHDS